MHVVTPPAYRLLIYRIRLAQLLVGRATDKWLARSGLDDPLFFPTGLTFGPTARSTFRTTVSVRLAARFSRSRSKTEMP